MSNKFWNQDNVDYTDKCKEDMGVSPLEFEIIVRKQAHSIERIIHVEVEGYCVYCVAETTRGTSEWEFSIDFDDNGHVTGNYDIRSENYESNIPEHFAKKIQRALMNKDIDNAFKKSVDDVKLAEAVNEHSRIQAKREATRTAERIEKERIAFETAKRQIELKDKENARTHRIIIFLIMLLVFLVVAGGIFIFFTERQHKKANEIHPPAYSSDFLEKNYEDVNAMFIEAGFKNIKLKTKKVSLIQRITKDEGDVYKVTIAGDEEFSKSDWFKKDSRVTIMYYTK